MLVTVAILVLLLTPVVMIFIHLVKPRFAFQYLLALFSALVVWLILLISRPATAQTITLISWQPEFIFPDSPALLLDRFSWPFGLALSTLLLAVVLTAVTRLDAIIWRAWAGSLLISGFGLLAVLAGNPLTLLIAWAALDITEAAILMIEAHDTSLRQKIVVILSGRAGGIVVLLVALITAWSQGENLSFLTIQPQIALLFLIAAGLRSGIFPLHVPFILETKFRRGLGTSLRLTSAATSLILIARTATSGVNEQIAPYLLMLTVITALYGAAAWATSPDELSGRTFWILGMMSFSASASIRAQPEASIAWGIACLFSGALVLLASPRNRSLTPLLILGALNLSSLPFTPLWSGWQAYGVLPVQQTSVGLILVTLSSLAYFFVHTFLILGYFRHFSRPTNSPDNMERWMWVLFLPGLIILILAHILFGIYELPELSTVPLAGWLSGALVSIVTLMIWWRGRSLLYRLEFLPRYFWRLESVLHFSWLYRVLGVAYRLVGRIVTMVSSILEGEGGLLWTMLIILLLFSLTRI